MAAGEPVQPTDTTDLAARYEELRSRALAGDGDGHRLGLGLLRRQGLVAWMRAWEQLPAVAEAATDPAGDAYPKSGTAGIVALLASMALAASAG